jgi:hypothetical protein
MLKALATARGTRAGSLRGSQLDEPDPIGIAVEEVGRHLEGEAGLPGAAHAGDRQQASRLEQTLDLGQLGAAPDEGRELGWQVVPGRYVRREEDGIGGRQRRRQFGDAEQAQRVQKLGKPGGIGVIESLDPLPAGQSILHRLGEAGGSQQEGHQRAPILPGELNFLLDVGRGRGFWGTGDNKSRAALDPSDDLGAPGRSPGDALPVHPDRDPTRFEEIGDVQRPLAVGRGVAQEEVRTNLAWFGLHRLPVPPKICLGASLAWLPLRVNGQWCHNS